MQIYAVSAWKSVQFAAKMTIQPKIQFLAVRSLFYIPVESITIRKWDHHDVETIKKNNIMNLIYLQYNF